MIQIAIPVLAEEWDEYSEIPPVVYIASESIDGFTTYLDGYLHNESVEIDAVNEPDYAVIVISKNERVVLAPEEPVAPSPPRLLTAKQTSTGILLNWQEPLSGNCNGYSIFRKEPGINNNYYIEIGNSTGKNNVSYFDEAVAYGTTYSYYVVAYYLTGAFGINSGPFIFWNNPFYVVTAPSILISQPSNTADAQAPPLTTPGAITLRTGVLKNSVDLEWPVAATGNSYEIWRKKTLEPNYSFISTNYGLSNNHYTDNYNLIGGEVYYYRVRTANGSGGYSGWSSSSAIHASDRVLKEPLVVKRMKFNKDKLKEVENWWRGEPELALLVTSGGTSGTANRIYKTIGFFRTGKRKNIDNKWWDHEITVLDEWEPNERDSVLTFSWFEKDQSGETSINITTSYEDKLDNASIKTGTTYTYTSETEDYEFSRKDVYWWENKAKTYATDFFNWEFK